VTRWDDALLDELRQHGDPEADDIVSAHFAAQPPDYPAGTVFQAIVHAGVPDEGDAALTAYLTDRPPLPDWADPALIRRGEDFFAQWGPQVLPSLLFASLPACYAAAKGVEVLHLTARLATDTRRRLVETTQMVIDVMGRDGLSVGRQGYDDARRVRLMHAAVRYLILNDPHVVRSCEPHDFGPHWCEDWGHPINQEDLLGTLMTFTEAVLDSMRLMGVDYDEADADAYRHTWNVVGHLLGIRPDLLPIDREGMRELWDTVRRRQYAPSVAGQEMATALLRFAEEEMDLSLLRGVPRAMFRYLAGDRVADLLSLPPAGPWSLVLGPVHALMRRISLHDRFVRRLSAHLNRAFLEACMGYARGGTRPDFAIPDHLADQWHVPVSPAR
jgi:hypothetical protein